MLFEIMKCKQPFLVIYRRQYQILCAKSISYFAKSILQKYKVEFTGCKILKTCGLIKRIQNLAYRKAKSIQIFSFQLQT